MVVATLSKKLGWDYYEKLRKNDIMMVQGNQQVSDMLKRGERLIAVGALEFLCGRRPQAGPSDRDHLSERRRVHHPVADRRHQRLRRNPNAAKLFAEFMLSEAAQKMFPEDGGYAARIDIAPRRGRSQLGDVKAIPIDYDEVEKDYRRA